MKKIVLIVISLLASNAQAAQLQVDIALADFGFNSNNPYIAIWLSDANGVHQPKLLLKEKGKWVRDLKQFWRKIARENQQQVDALSGATTTKKRLHYQFSLANQWTSVSIEVAREKGGREVVTLPINGQGQSCLAGRKEIKNACIHVTSDI